MGKFTDAGFFSANATTEASPGTQREPRQRVLKKGVISYNRGAITCEVLVRDLSASGCKLKCVIDVPVPDRFRLEIPMDGWQADCEVRWREGDVLGIRFEDEPTVRNNVMRPVIMETVTARPRSILRRRDR